jgi:hypothetical protein
VSCGACSVIVSYGNVAPYERGGVEAAINEVLEHTAPTLRRVDKRGPRQKTSTEPPLPTGQGESGPVGSSRGGPSAAVSGGAYEVELRPKAEWSAARAAEWVFRRFQVLGGGSKARGRVALFQRLCRRLD